MFSYGKYSYGYNYPSVVEGQNDSLTIINLSVPLVNTLNLMAAVFFGVVLVPVFCLVYEAVKKKKAEAEEELQPDRGSTAKMTTRSNEE